MLVSYSLLGVGFDKGSLFACFRTSSDPPVGR